MQNLLVSTFFLVIGSTIFAIISPWAGIGVASLIISFHFLIQVSQSEEMP